MKVLIALFLVFTSLSLMAGNILSWTYPPVQISSSGINASSPQVGVDQNGNSVAVWIESGVVKASNINYGGSWTTPVAISSGSGASNPRLVVDQNGNATAIWLQNGTVEAASQPINGNWSSVTAISGTGASSPEIAVDNSGDVVAVWVTSSNIQSATCTFGGSWPVTPDVIYTSSGDSPQVAIEDGLVVAVWHAVASSVDTIFAVEKQLKGSWGSPTAISGTTNNCVNPQVAVDSSGNVLAVWFRYQLSGSAYSNVYVQAAMQTSGGSWGTPVDLSQQGYYNPNDLVLAAGFDGYGNAVVNWNISLDGSTFTCQAAVMPFGKNWTSAITLVPSNLCAYALDLSVDTFGHAVTAFMSYDPLNSVVNVQAVKMNINAYGLGWVSGYAQFSTGSYNAYPLLNIMANQDNIYLASVWMNFDGNNEVVFATTGLALNYDPPTNLKVVQNVNNFNLFNEYYNTISWSPSTYPNTWGYLVFRNGIFIANITPGTILEYVDQNQIEKGAVTYGVAAYDDTGEQSAIVYINYP